MMASTVAANVSTGVALLAVNSSRDPLRLRAQASMIGGGYTYLRGGRLRQNLGRLQFGTLDGIKSERWAPSPQNACTACVGICTRAKCGSTATEREALDCGRGLGR